MRACVAIVAASAFLSGAAVAQDDLPIPSDFNWTGFYVGGHLGAAWGEAEFDAVTDTIFPGFIVGPPPVLIVPSRGGALPETDVSDVGILGGAQAGVNWQIGRLVLGAEGDISGTGLDDSASFLVSTAPPGLGVGQVLTGIYSVDVEWMASLRGRVGLALDRFLIYVTGGVSHISADVDSSFTLVNTNPGILFPAVGASGTTTASDSVSTFGWMFGGGLEWALGNRWSLAAEYRHAAFGSASVDLAATDPSGLLGLPALSTDVDLSVDQGTLRLNYRFGAP
jgi:outer membrane immunogenic protein